MAVMTTEPPQIVSHDITDSKQISLNDGTVSKVEGLVNGGNNKDQVPIASGKHSPPRTQEPAESRSTSQQQEQSSSQQDDTATSVVDTSMTSPPQSSPAEAPSKTSDETAKRVDAPPSPPVPTPPLYVSTSMNHDHPALSELSIASPPPPTTSVPALVDQVLSDVRDSSKMVDDDGKDGEASKVNNADTSVESMNESATVSASHATTTGEDVKEEQHKDADAEMTDAPHISETPSAPIKTTAGKVREREGSVDMEERPLKRAKTEDVEEKMAVSPKDHVMTDSPAIDSTAEREVTSGSAETKTPLTPLQYKYCLQSIRSLKRLKDSGPFILPVDAVKLNIPTYYDVIKNPMTVSGIEKKLATNSYTYVDELIADFRLIIANTIAFNGVDNLVTQMGKRMEEAFDRYMKALPSSDQVEASPKGKKKAQPKKASASTTSRSPVPVAKAASPILEAPVLPVPVPPAPAPVVVAKPPPPPPQEPPVVPKIDTKPRRDSIRGSAKSPGAGSPTFSLQPSGMPVIRRDSFATNDGRPKRPIHPPPPRDLPYSDLKPRRKKAVAELKFCDSVLKELMKKTHESYAYPFYNPVDPVALNIPDYFKIIRKPMDLGTIQSRLKQNEYDGSHDFEADIRQMFSNCYKFNPGDSVVAGMGKKLEAVFDAKWNEKPNFKEQKSESASPQPEDDHDDDMSDEELESNDTDVMAMQARIEEMAKELEKMKKGKKNTPPAQSAGHKKRNSVSMGSITTSNKKSKKSSSRKKKEEVPYITFDQKQELSERINTLSQAKVAQCLKIIQENMPSLSRLGGDEIELDIDELSPDVLNKLYKFVVKNSNPPSKSSQPDTPASSTSTGKGGRAVNKPKKNKPMSATEQERKIQELEHRLSGFKNGVALPTDAPRSLASMQQGLHDAEESSSDDESSSGSESEEE